MEKEVWTNWPNGSHSTALHLREVELGDGALVDVGPGNRHGRGSESPAVDDGVHAGLHLGRGKVGLGIPDGQGPLVINGGGEVKPEIGNSIHLSSPPLYDEIGPGELVLHDGILDHVPDGLGNGHEIVGFYGRIDPVIGTGAEYWSSVHVGAYLYPGSENSVHGSIFRHSLRLHCIDLMFIADI